MTTTIQEIEQIDAIECLPSGAVQVKKGTYYQKVVTETVPIFETIEVRTPVVDQDGDPVTETKGVLNEDGTAKMTTQQVMVEQAVVDENGDAVLDGEGQPTTEMVAAQGPDGQPLTEEVQVTEQVPVENVTSEQRDTGETKEVSTETLDHVSNWRGVIGLRDESRAEELLGEKKSVALAHWESFPETGGEQLAKPTESNTIPEIKAYLDQQGISYASNENKAGLLALVPE